MCRISYYSVVSKFFLEYFDTHSISEHSGGWSCCIQMGGNWMGFLFPAKCQRKISNLVLIYNFDIGIESSDFKFYIFPHFPIPLPRLTFPRPRPRPCFPLFPWPRKPCPFFPRHRPLCALFPRGFDGVTRNFGWTFFSRMILTLSAAFLFRLKRFARLVVSLSFAFSFSYRRSPFLPFSTLLMRARTTLIGCRDYY